MPQHPRNPQGRAIKSFWTHLFTKRWAAGGIIILVVLSAWYLNQQRGPYWLGSNSDPEYVYLLNAANLAMLKGVGHIDHPGTPVQALGAVVTRVVYLSRVISGATQNGYQEDILTRPEHYLNTIQWVMIALNGFLLFIIGWVAISMSGNIWMGLWLQVSVFFSPVLLQFGFTRVTPEPLLLFSSSAMALAVLLWVYGADIWKRRPWLMVVVPALIVGFGVANKITFAPVALLPLFVLKGVKQRIYYIIGAGLSFVLFTLPILRMYPRFFGWIFKLLGHSGKYGSGASGLASSGEYLGNIAALVTGNLFFGIILVISGVVIGAIMVVPSWRREVRGQMVFRLLCGGFTAQVAGLLMVSKHSASHYLLPVANLSGVMLVLVFLVVKGLAASGELKVKPVVPAILLIAVVVVSFVLVNPVGGTLRIAKELKGLKENSLVLRQTIETKYKDYAKIYFYRCSAPEYGLKFGSDLSRSYHADALQTLYKDVFFYDIWTQQFQTFDYNRTLAYDGIREKYGDRIVFMGSRGTKIKGLQLTDVSPVKTYEGIFLVKE